MVRVIGGGSFPPLDEMDKPMAKSMYFRDICRFIQTIFNIAEKDNEWLGKLNLQASDVRKIVETYYVDLNIFGFAALSTSASKNKNMQEMMFALDSIEDKLIPLVKRFCVECSNLQLMSGEGTFGNAAMAM